MHVVVGFIIMAAGLVFIIKTEWFLRNFGRIGFFERHLGLQGGSRLGYKILGLIITFIGLLVAVNLFSGFLAVILSPLTKHQI